LRRWIKFDGYLGDVFRLERFDHRRDIGHRWNAGRVRLTIYRHTS